MTEKHVLGLSGGRDSAALAVFMRQYQPEVDVHYFFTDTGKELPEVYEFLIRLEGFLGRPIQRLNPDRDFDFWLREYGHFLPSPKTRWCTRQLKLRPFEQWIKSDIEAGNRVISYVAIRADEPQRVGHISTHPNLSIRFPFRDHGVDKTGVFELLESSGLGLPGYYGWRSRSGCTFCFYQQKIEWVRLKREHPEAFEEAKRYAPFLGSFSRTARACARGTGKTHRRLWVRTLMVDVSLLLERLYRNTFSAAARPPLPCRSADGERADPDSARPCKLRVEVCGFGTRVRSE